MTCFINSKNKKEYTSTPFIHFVCALINCGAYFSGAGLLYTETSDSFLLPRHPSVYEGRHLCH